MALGVPKVLLNDCYRGFLSLGAPALVLASSRGSAKCVLNKGSGKSAANLLAFLLLLIICGVFQVHIKELVLERALAA